MTITRMKEEKFGRIATIKRVTKETDIAAKIDLDGSGKHNISTEIGFLAHMLETFSTHSLIDIDIDIKGDIKVDYHHSVEDSGIVLGLAVNEALGQRRGINRFGEAILPMDEALVTASIDCSSRPYLVWNVDLARDKIGDMDSELFKEWFRAFAYNSGLTLHINHKYGTNSHHIIEACYKALARALRKAISFDARRNTIASTKGSLKS